MDVDDSAVDLSVRALPPELSELRALTASGLTITPAQAPLHGATGKRVLRPRSEQRSYAESPDIVLLPAAPPHRKPSLNTTPAPFTELSGKLSVNVSITPSAAPNLPGPESPPRDPMDQDEDSDDNDVGTDVNGGSPHKELSSADIWERERKLRTLREKLRAEETKLVLLKKIRQSQQQPVLPAPKQDSVSATALAGSGCVVPPGVTVTPAPPPAHQHAKRSTTNSVAHMIPSSSVSSGRTSSLPGGATLTPGPYRTQSSSGGASITPSVTITPAPPPTAHLSSNNSGTKASSRSSEDSGTPAQRQAAAKLALRKQLEKTLLQIPPPKPPPPEMNFIPSPSNTDFVYLVGLEHVVDYLTSEERLPRGSVPAVCAQCSCDFTAVWRWERAAGTGTARRGDATFAHGGARVLCELCVSGNVKRALKAEHTARLKTAFVRALQQEQEIERRLSAPAPSPPPAHSSRPQQAPQAAAPRSSSRGSSASSASVPAPATSKNNNTSSSRGMGSESLRSHHSERSSERSEVPAKKGKTSSSSNSSQKSSSNQHQMAAAAAAQMAFEQHSAAAMQALQHQLIRGLSGASGVGGVQSGGSMSSAAAAAAMMQFSPLLYTYQLAMAQAQVIAAGSGKSSGNSSSSGNAAIAAEMQRAVEVQRQYLLDMIPGQHGRSPWSNK